MLQAEAFEKDLEPVLVELGMLKGCPFSVVGIDSNDSKTVVSLFEFCLRAVPCNLSPDF